MQHTNPILERIFPGEKMAALLQLTLEEYASIDHSAISPIFDTHGHLIKYYIIVHRDPPEEIKEKMRINRYGMVYFDVADLLENGISINYCG